MTIAELTDAFLSGCQNTLAPNTLRAYRSDLSTFSSAFPKLTAEQVSVQHLRAFLASVAELAPSTLARRQASLRSAFGWAYRNGLIDADPTGRLDPVRVAIRDPRPLSAEQVEAVLRVIPAGEKRNRMMLTLLYETGMRVGEALGIGVQDVILNDVDGGCVRVLGKGGRERLVPLIDAPRSVRLLREFTRRAGPAGPLFRGDLAKGGKPGESMRYATLYYHFERYVQLARKRTPSLFGDGEPITIHRLRHTYATQRLRDGVSIQSVRKLLGHRSIQTTLRYAETDLETIKAELLEARRRSRLGNRK